MSAFDSFEEIRNVIDGADDGQDAGPSTERITIMSTDPLANINAQMTALRNENVELRSRLKRLEMMVMPLVADSKRERIRTKAGAPSTSMFGMRSPSPVRSPTPSRSPTRIATMPVSGTTFVDPFTTMPPDPMPGMMMTKSSSAIASMGYVGKKQLWGTAVASYLIGACRYYITKTGSDLITIDEGLLMKNMTAIVTTLYNGMAQKDLPAVKDPRSIYLAKAISRLDKNDIPVSDARTWTDMMKTQDGSDVVNIINVIISSAKRVPEAVAHPISQIVPLLFVPVSRVIDSKPIFAMIATGSVSITPTRWEVWCSMLKDNALTKHIQYRMSGMTETMVVSKMVSEMRPTDLVEKRNLERIREVAPYTLTYRDPSTSTSTSSVPTRSPSVIGDD